MAARHSPRQVPLAESLTSRRDGVDGRMHPGLHGNSSCALFGGVWSTPQPWEQSVRHFRFASWRLLSACHTRWLPHGPLPGSRNGLPRRPAPRATVSIVPILAAPTHGASASASMILSLMAWPPTSLRFLVAPCPPPVGRGSYGFIIVVSSRVARCSLVAGGSSAYAQRSESSG